jgi:hypothetical protein
MNFKIFDDKIVVPTKCGTRYCEQIFPTYENVWDYHWYPSKDILNKTYWIVYRHPIKHLISALQTEMLMVFNGNDSSTIEMILDRFLSDSGTTHWSNQICQDLYNHWSKNHRKVNLIEINDLSSTLESLGYGIVDFNESDYAFNNLPILKSKEECIEYIKQHHPQHWDTLYSYALKDVLYYEKLKNKERVVGKLI